MDTKVTIRIDKNLLDAFSEYCRSCGSNVSTELRRHMVHTAQSYSNGRLKKHVDQEYLRSSRVEPVVKNAGDSVAGVHSSRPAIAAAVKRPSSSKPQKAEEVSRQVRRQLERDAAKKR